jgi:hypothetical protein
LPYRITPAGIGSRTSPFGNEPTLNPDTSRVTMARAHPRTRGLLGAVWHLGYAAQAAAAGVESLALGAPVGEFGLVHAPQSYKQPWYDQAGGAFPAFSVMRGLYAASGASVFAVTTSAPREVQGLCFEASGKRELWLANLTGETQFVQVTGFAASAASVLDENSFQDFVQLTRTASISIRLMPPLR